GVGADVGLITKNTQAWIDSGVIADADGDIKVKAHSVEDITSVAAGLAASGTVSVGLDASVHTLEITTRAFIGDDPWDNNNADPETLSAGAGHVHAQGDIIVEATDTTEADKVVGVLAVSGTAGIGAAGTVTIADKTTEAFIGNGAWVIAEGRTTGAETVVNGQFTTGVNPSPDYFDASGNSADTGIQSSSITSEDQDINTLKSQGDIGTPDLADMDAKQDGGDDLRGDSLNRTIATGTQSDFHGLAVGAVNRDTIRAFTVSIGGGTVGIAISATVNVIDTSTNAYIGANARINDGAEDPGSSQSVLVAAGSDFQHMAVAGSLGAGVAAVSPAVDVTVLDQSITGEIRFGALVAAQNDVMAEAHA
ncbi:hypothetical protein EG829_30475, partial [bacterium]|nr:hypothetical protein [bacterium]